MARIKVLDDQLANQIAAGEVVERPASVVKELVENAVDAGSTLIDISLEEGGLSYIRVVDNGYGIEASDITAAFQRHATSKISKNSDLFRILRPGYHFSGGPEDNWGWEELSTEPTTTWGIPGAHYTMLEGDSVQTLTRQLTTRLDQIQDGTETAVAETDVRRHPTAAGQQASMA